MTLEETRSRISEIISAASDYQSSVNALQGELVAFSSNLNSMYSSIASEITETSIVEYCTKNSGEISSALNSCLSAIQSALGILSQDATRKIKELVDAYNNSIDPKEGGERLSYTEVNLSAGGGSITVFSGGGSSGTKGGSGSTGSSGNTNSNYGGSYYGGGYQDYPYYDPDYDTDTDFYFDDGTDSDTDTDIENDTDDDSSNRFYAIDYYLEQVTSSGIYSADITGWDELIKEFLEENHLDYYVKKLELDGNIIKCTLFNDKEYELKDILTKEDLLVQLKELIKRASIK